MSPALRGRDLACQEMVELVTDYLEGALSPAMQRRFEAHLQACDGCDEYLAQVKETITVLGRLEPDVLAPETRSGLIALFRQVAGSAETP